MCIRDSANPALAVRIEYGYFDLATPYFAAQDMVDHLRLPAVSYTHLTLPTIYLV